MFMITSLQRFVDRDRRAIAVTVRVGVVGCVVAQRGVRHVVHGEGDIASLHTVLFGRGPFLVSRDEEEGESRGVWKGW